VVKCKIVSVPKQKLIKAYVGMEVKLHAFFTLILNGGEWLVSRSGCFIAEERTTGTHEVGGCTDPRVGPNIVKGKGKVVPDLNQVPGHKDVSIA
jgi:hypothetical protein